MHDMNTTQINLRKQIKCIAASIDMADLHILPGCTERIRAAGWIDEKDGPARQHRWYKTIKYSQIVVATVRISVRRLFIEIDVGLNTQGCLQQVIAFGDQQHLAMHRATNDGPGIVVDRDGIL